MVARFVRSGVRIHVFQFLQRLVQMAPDYVCGRDGFPFSSREEEPSLAGSNELSEHLSNRRVKIDLTKAASRLEPLLDLPVTNLLLDVEGEVIGRDVLIDLDAQYLADSQPRCTAHDRLIAAGETDDPWPLIIPIEDSGHTPDRGCSTAWLMEVVEWARRGHPDANRALMLILEAERKGAIIAQLITHGIRWQDIEDLHHEVLVRISERIGQLQWTAAYYKWEARIVRDLCRPWWRLYREMGEPLEALPENQRKPTAS